VVHRTCESRKQVNADKAVMKWCVKQCAAMFVQYKHKRHTAICAAADTVAGLFKTKFSASDGWHDITNGSKCGEAHSAPALYKQAAYRGGQGVVPLLWVSMYYYNFL
jgi:hypothetical protein